MSGTSLDGIDAALVSILPYGASYAVELRRFSTYPFASDVRALLREALPPNAGTVEGVARLQRALGIAFARAAVDAAGDDDVAFVASHGQTLWHDGAAHITLQSGDAFLIREAAGATVCYDFRSADCAAGGEGAPLVPYVDALLLTDATEHRVTINLGGIANVTLLRAGEPPENAVGFDTGPGGMLLDAFVRERTHGARQYDAGGELATAGRFDGALLRAMLADPYFAAAPPKTTGRERFGAQFLMQHRDALGALSLEDGAATLVELTAGWIAGAIDDAGFGDARAIVSGGGAHNAALLARLGARLERARVETSDAVGIPVDAKEAIAFAVLGYETLRERAANAPRATGASRAVVLGAIAPHRLRELFAAISAECASAP